METDLVRLLIQPDLRGHREQHSCVSSEVMQKRIQAVLNIQASQYKEKKEVKKK